MNLYRISVKNNEFNYDCYDGFIVVGSSISDALETVYQHVCEDEEDGKTYYKDIPYYLRSSNLTIENVGEIKLDKNIKDKILMIDYSNA